MKLIVGLGNPGKKYAETRHNVGFMALDRFVKRIQSLKLKVKNSSLKFKIDKKFESYVLRFDDVVLAKPQTFMNRSGIAVKKLVNHVAMKQLNNLFVVHDDLDIPLGKYKIQFGRGPRQHKGLESIYEALGSPPSHKASARRGPASAKATARRGKNFWHVRIGIEGRAKGEEFRIAGERYVLQRFAKEEWEVIDQVIGEVVVDIQQRLHQSSF
jgi:PTH1 family peptidyl-tRNA hydrolase